MKKYLYILILVLIPLFMVHCVNEPSYVENPDAHLGFNLDTVYFDTVFTRVETVTRSFRIYNPYKRFIKIENIQLAKGENSMFRINVDGVPGTSFTDFELAPEDSMYVFVEATLSENLSPDILRIQDSIVFSVNGNLQDIDLVAWGQDVHMLKDSVLDYSTTWTADKPYLIINGILVDTLQTLRIEEGVKIHMHRDAVIFVLGSLDIAGSLEEPVIIQGDRLEEDYKDIPGQWGFIMFVNGSENNSIDHAEIRNGTIGLFVNSPLYSEVPVLSISNSEINQMSYAGIRGMGSSIDAYNTIIGDAGNSSIELLFEGAYTFNHCTVANYWNSGFSNRKTPAVYIQNFLDIQNEAGEIERLVSDIVKAEFTNSIIFGSRQTETIIVSEDIGQCNTLFDYCLLKFDEEEYDYFNDPSFSNILHNQSPMFDSLRVIYELDSLSPAIDAGKLEFALEHPFDKKGVSRIQDSAPDLGALERIIEE